MADVVEEIKSRLGIEELVGQYVQLKKAGRNFKGLCPFHSENTPSFVVSPEKQICHCFGCNKGGDIFTFVEEVEGVTFAEALEFLADKAGVKLDKAKLKKQAGKKSEKDIYYKAHDLACEFFEKQLHETNDGKKVLDYLYKRGLKDETIKDFRLGFAPDKYDALYPFLIKKGIPKDVLIKAGLISAKNLASDQVYDKYRTRLIFPIFDYMGRVCGFGGRALKSEQMPKYLNSPENMIYSKSKVLYGLSHGKKAIKEEDKIVLVEGYFDVILPSQEGIGNVVASSGTALSGTQVKQVKRLTKNVVTCFDNDSAGFEATKRSFFLFQKEDVMVKTVKDMEGKDPADYVLENGDDFKKLVDGSIDFVSFYMTRLIKDNDVNSLEGRKKILNELMPCFQGMSAAEKDYFVRELSSELGMKEKFLYEEMENFKLPTDHPARGVEEVVAVGGPVKIALPETVVALLLEYPGLFEKVSKSLGNDDFEDELKSVYKVLTDQYNSSRDKFETWDLNTGFLASVKGKIGLWKLYAEERYSEFSEETLPLELDKLIDRMRKDRKSRDLSALQIEISSAEKEENKEKLRELLEKQQDLIKS